MKTLNVDAVAEEIPVVVVTEVVVVAMNIIPAVVAEEGVRKSPAVCLRTETVDAVADVTAVTMTVIAVAITKNRVAMKDAVVTMTTILVIALSIPLVVLRNLLPISMLGVTLRNAKPWSSSTKTSTTISRSR